MADIENNAPLPSGWNSQRHKTFQPPRQVQLAIPCYHSYDARGGGRPKILVWQAIVNLSNIGMADCGR